MRAAIYQGIEKIAIEENPIPKTPQGGILLKILGCAVCGSDVRTYFFGNSLISPPWIIGHETVGEIVENLSGNGMSIGQRVTVATAIPCGYCMQCQQGHYTMCENMKAHGFEFPGGYAEYMAIDPYAIKRGVLNCVPDHLSSEEACLTEPLACVLNGQERLQVGLGDRVLVIGAGAIGCMHMQVARARGAQQVLALEVNEKRLNIAQQFADHIANPHNEDPKQFIEKWTRSSGGVDVVIVACGAADAQALALELAAPRGRICNFGGLPKTNPFSTINANLMHYKELTVLGSFSSSPHHNRLALEMISSNIINVKPLISKKLPLESLESAILEMRQGTSMKIVIQP